MAEIPQLRADSRNWTDYREKILRMAAQQNLDKLYNGTETLQGDAEDWQQRNAIAKALIVETIPDSIFLRILHFESAYEFFKALKNLFEQDAATLELLRELRNNRTKRDTAYSPEPTNDRVRRRSHVTDKSRRDDEVSNRSGRRSVDVPRSEPRPERKREPTSQRRVKRRRGVGEEGRVSKGEKDDEQVAAASGVSLVNPTSSQGHLPRARVDTPQPHPTSTSPPSTPSMPVEQTAPTSRRPTRQRRRDGHVPRTGTRRKREDGEGSRRGVESRDRGSREAVDEDGEDVHVHHANVEPQQPQTVGQTAVDDEAADTTDPHANSTGPAVPVGTTNGPPNESNGGRDRERGRNVEEEDEKGGRASESAAPSSNDDGGDEDVRHAYVVPKPAPPSPNHVPPPPDERRPPPSVPLEGEEVDQKSSGHADEAATHLERPPDESTTQQPGRTPYDQTSNGESRGEAVNGDDEVEGSKDDDTKTSYRVEERRSRRKEAKDETRGDEEGQETRKGERGRTRDPVRTTTATNANEHDQHTSNDEDSPRTPPEPPPPHHPSPPPTPIHPERPDDVDTAKSNRTAARRRADDVHDPGGQTDAPDSVPPSVRLEGEKIRRTSLRVELTDVETSDVDETSAEEAGRPPGQSKARKPPRDPVGTPDGDSRRPNGPTEPPDEEKGARRGNGEMKVNRRVETVEEVETEESRRVDEPGDEEVEESRSKEVEGEIGDQSEEEGCQRDGRTNDTGDATSSASCDSLRVETGALAEHEDGQQQNGTQNISTDVPTPSTPSTKRPKRPTHHANPPRRRGRLKTQPMKVSQPERTVYAPSQTVELTTYPDQSDVTETVQGYWGSIPKPPDSRSNGTEARTSTPHPYAPTSRELPNRVTARA
ncbi:hypothetical protein PAXINDRAFT_18829 [Paxillus involutus ATCC 200175]|uniref:Unplaced genomic scaffold PAXINscaffold_403, whole genome shotgun sequence n=1 Tax=Paxillus involutus ATCC 200175 TaxID=664439 RepID=A0A0C9SY04_PAXIN|nr:hypothetical protein PAXINDRAFT_18829 [Paxillus involutus ATCC 200175]